MFDRIKLDGNVSLKHYRGPDLIYFEDLGRQTVTTVGKNWLVDKMQDIPASTEKVKFHQTGLTSTPAAATNTALFSSLYNRTTGTQTEGASSNIYRSVATVAYTGSHTIVEWGIFTTSSSGTLFARKTFSRAVISGDSIQFTWDLTVS